MDPEQTIGPRRFRRVKTLFQVVADAPPDERASLLSTLCPDDDTVRRITARLLREPDRGNAILDRAELWLVVLERWANSPDEG